MAKGRCRECGATRVDLAGYCYLHEHLALFEPSRPRPAPVELAAAGVSAPVRAPSLSLPAAVIICSLAAGSGGVTWYLVNSALGVDASFLLPLVGWFVGFCASLALGARRRSVAGALAGTTTFLAVATSGYFVARSSYVESAGGGAEPVWLGNRILDGVGDAVASSPTLILFWVLAVAVALRVGSEGRADEPVAEPARKLLQTARS